MLRLGRCRLDVTVDTLMMIDSLEMTDADRQLILERCAAAPARRIVITHGTDSMEQTAAVLGRGIHGKTVVLTGAMVPYQFGSSDGMFNLGTALAFVQALGTGRLRSDERAMLPVAFGAQESRAGDLRVRRAGRLIGTAHE